MRDFRIKLNRYTRNTIVNIYIYIYKLASSVKGLIIQKSDLGRGDMSANIILLVYIFFFRDFNASVSRWFFTGVLVTASLLKSPGLISVFWPISTMLLSGWSPIVVQFSSHSVAVPILW